MYISIYGNVNFHWWGNELLLLQNLGRYCILEEEERFFLQYLTHTTNVNELVKQISSDLEEEKETIENFIKIFMENYKDYFFFSNEENLSKLFISGKRGAYFPIEIHISLTSVCVQKCMHCYKSATNKGIYIDNEALCTFLDEMKGYVPYLTLSGGEPTLHPAFSKIMKNYAENYSICILSSGYKIKGALLEYISLAKRGLVVSIYSSEPAKHDNFAGVEGSYLEIMKTLDIAQKKRIPVGVTTILTSDNYEDINKLVKMLSAKKISNISVGQISSMGRAKENSLEEKTEQLKEIKIKSEELQNNYKNITIFERRDEKEDRLPLSPLKCGAGSLSWAVYENGEIHPCGMNTFPELAMGSIKKFDDEILYNRKRYVDRISKLECICSMKEKGKKCPFDI